MILIQFWILARLTIAALLHGGNKFSIPLVFANAIGVAEFALISKDFLEITLFNAVISATVTLDLQL
ncbi:hypothetical protein [Polaribacter sp.]|uniref:hypothetical protein n=1 Tax=Polaribacter sp. TaxID=1920175 RepID=UPI0040481009